MCGPGPAGGLTAGEVVYTHTAMLMFLLVGFVLMLVQGDRPVARRQPPSALLEKMK